MVGPSVLVGLVFLTRLQASAAGTQFAQGWTQIGINGTDDLVDANDADRTPVQHVCPDHPYDQSIYYPGFSAEGCQAVIEAWGGGALNSDTNQMVLFGGGHSDYGGNEIYLMDFMNNPPKWHRPFGPTLPGAGMQAGGYSCTGAPNPGPLSSLPAVNSPTPCQSGGIAPNSRHSYGGVTFIPAGSDASGQNHPELFIQGGSIASNGGGGANDAWLFDFVTNSWLGGMLFNGSSIGLSTDGLSNNIEWDPVNKVVYMAIGIFAAYNPASAATPNAIGGSPIPAKTFRKLNGQEPNSTSMYGVIDQTDRVYVVVSKDSLDTFSGVGGFNIEEFNLNTGAVTWGWQGTRTGNPLPGCPGDPNGPAPNGCEPSGQTCSATYDTSLGKVVFHATRTSNDIFIYDHATHSCTHETYGSNSAVSPATMAGLAHGSGYGRFRYVPSQNYYVYVASAHDAPFILCRNASGCGGGTRVTVAPAKPRGLQWQ